MKIINGYQSSFRKLRKRLENEFKNVEEVAEVGK